MKKKMDKKIVIEEYLQGNISYNDFLKSLDKELMVILNKRYMDAIKTIFFHIVHILIMQLFKNY